VLAAVVAVLHVIPTKAYVEEAATQEGVRPVRTIAENVLEVFCWKLAMFKFCAGRAVKSCFEMMLLVWVVCSAMKMLKLAQGVDGAGELSNSSRVTAVAPVVANLAVLSGTEVVLGRTNCCATAAVVGLIS
jgi:hypothetical protein